MIVSPYNYKWARNFYNKHMLSVTCCLVMLFCCSTIVYAQYNTATQYPGVYLPQNYHHGAHHNHNNQGHSSSHQHHNQQHHYQNSNQHHQQHQVNHHHQQQQQQHHHQQQQQQHHHQQQQQQQHHHQQQQHYDETPSDSYDDNTYDNNDHYRRHINNNHHRSSSHHHQQTQPQQAHHHNQHAAPAPAANNNIQYPSNPPNPHDVVGPAANGVPGEINTPSYVPQIRVVPVNTPSSSFDNNSPASMQQQYLQQLKERTERETKQYYEYVHWPHEHYKEPIVNTMIVFVICFIVACGIATYLFVGEQSNLFRSDFGELFGSESIAEKLGMASPSQRARLLQAKTANAEAIYWGTNTYVDSSDSGMSPPTYQQQQQQQQNQYRHRLSPKLWCIQTGKWAKYHTLCWLYRLWILITQRRVISRSECHIYITNRLATSCMNVQNKRYGNGDANSSLAALQRNGGIISGNGNNNTNMMMNNPKGPYDNIEPMTNTQSLSGFAKANKGQPPPQIFSPTTMQLRKVEHTL